MTNTPEEHDFIKEVCAGENCTAYSDPDSPEHSNECLAEAAKSQGWEFTNNDVPPRMSDDPLVRLEECRSALNFDQYRMESAIAGCRIVMPDLKKSEFKPFLLGAKAALDAVEKYRSEQAFDEAAERAKFEAWHGDEYGYAGCTTHCESRREGWLACARARHNESTMQGEE